MVRKSVRRQEALRRSRECRLAKDAAETAPPKEVPQPDTVVMTGLTETERRRHASTTCGWCSGPIEYKARGRIPKWCSAMCRQRAWEQSRAAASGRCAVQVIERRVEVPVEKPAPSPPRPRHTEWVSLLDELAEQLDTGAVYDRDLAQLTVALNRVLEAFQRHPDVRRWAHGR